MRSMAGVWGVHGSYCKDGERLFSENAFPYIHRKLSCIFQGVREANEILKKHN